MRPQVVLPRGTGLLLSRAALPGSGSAGSHYSGQWDSLQPTRDPERLREDQAGQGGAAGQLPGRGLASGKGAGRQERVEGLSEGELPEGPQKDLFLSKTYKK